jgi:hypothetical protein
MLAIIRFVWARISDAHTAFWFLPSVAVTSSAVIGLVASIFGGIGRLPIYLWIPLGLIVFILAALLTHLILWLRERIRQLKGSPFEIIFDSTNFHRKFWSIEPMRDADGKQIAGSYWEYRAIVKNKSTTKLENVKIIIEAIGAMPTRPEISHFDINKKPLIDLTPNEETLVVIRCWPNPPIFAGMASGEDMYGPIKMVATADNALPFTRIFHFDPEKNPMIYE